MSDTFFSVAITLGWILAVWIATVKYLRAFRAKKKADAWIWFFLWCGLISFIEWPVFFLYTLVMKILGA